MWTCHNCGECGEENFEACWNCGAERDDSASLSAPPKAANRAARDFGSKREIMRRHRTSHVRTTSTSRERQSQNPRAAILPVAGRIQAGDFPATWDDEAAQCPQCGIRFTSQFMQGACFAPRVECQGCGTALRAVRKTNKPSGSKLPALFGAGLGILIFIILASLNVHLLWRCLLAFALPLLALFIIIPIVSSVVKSSRPRVVGFRVIEVQPVSDNHQQQ